MNKILRILLTAGWTAVFVLKGQTAVPDGGNVVSGADTDYYWNNTNTDIDVTNIVLENNGSTNGYAVYGVVSGESWKYFGGTTNGLSASTYSLSNTSSSTVENISGRGTGVEFTVKVIRYNNGSPLDTADAGTFEYRETTPTPTDKPDLVSSNDTGPSDSDDHTNDTSVEVSMANANTSNDHTITLYVGSDLNRSESGSAANLQWSATLSEGTNEIKTVTKDPYGSEGTSTILYVYCDLTSPSAPSVVSEEDADQADEWNLLSTTDSGISEWDRLTNDNTPTFRVGGSELATWVNNVGWGFGRAVIYIDGVAIDSTTETGSNDWVDVTIENANALADGTYTVTTVIVDASGNRSNASNPITLRIDTDADATNVDPDLDTDANNDTGISQTDHNTSVTTPIFVISGAGVLKGDSIEVKNGATWIAGGWVAADGSISVQVPAANALSEGTFNSIAAFVIDSAGNTSSATANLSPDLVVDATNPADPASAPSLKSGHDTGTLNNDRLTNRRTPTFVFAAENTTDYIDVYKDGVENSSTLAGATNNIEIPISGIGSDGTYEITYKVVDVAGNESNASAAFSVRVDSTAPAAIQSINMVEDGTNDTGESQTDKITTNQTPQFQIDLADASTSVADADSVILYFTDKSDGSTNAVDAEILTADPHTIQPTSNQDEGEYFVTAAILDSAGNLRDTTGLYQSITIDRTGPDAPSGIDLQTADDSGKSDSDDITLETTLVFTVSGVTSGDSVFVLFGTDTVGRGKASATTVDVTVNSAVEGTHNVKSIAKDPAGNLGTASNTLISGLVVDVTKPTKPTNLDLVDASDTGISPSDGITNDNTPTFTADGLSADDSVDIYFGSKASVGTITVSGPVDVDGTITLTPGSAVADGEYWVRIKSIDPAGNTSDASDSVYVQIDTDAPNAPTITGILPADDSGHHNNDGYTNVRQPTIIVTNLDATENDSVRVFYTGSTAAVDSVVADGHGGTDNLKPESNLPEGTHLLRAVAIDSAGNVSDTTTLANGYTLVIDITDPNSISAADLIGTSDSGTDSTDNLTNDITPSFKITSNDGFVGDSVFVVLKKGALQDTLGKHFAESGNAKTIDISPVPIDTSASAFGNGTIEVHAYAVDSAGNISTTLAGASLLDIIIDTQAPDAPTISLRTNDDSGVLNTDNLTNVLNPDFNIWGSSGTDSSYIAANADTVSRAVPTANPDIVTTDSLAGGIYSYTAKLRDYAGNLSLVSAAVSVEIDTTPPAKASGAPDLLAASDSGWVSDTDNITNAAQPWFIISGISPASPGKIDSIFLLKDSSSVAVSSWSSQLNSDTLQVQAASALNSGIYTFNVFSMDSAGNISDTSAALSLVKIDLADPSTPAEPDLIAASDLGDASNDNITKDNSPTFRTTNLESGTQMKFYVVDNTSTAIDSIVSVVEADSTGTNFTITEGSVPEGTYSFYATSEDTAGNKVQSATLSNVILDYTAPVCSLTFSNETQTHITNLGKYQDQISLVAKFSEHTGTSPAPVLHVQYADSTTDSFTGTAGIGSNNDTTWTFSFTLPDSSKNDGSLKATLTSFDVAGNKTPIYVDSTAFVVDNTDPAAFTVSTITTFGYNQHLGWINGKTDSVSIVVPIDQTDATLLNGGDIYVQMRIPLRMAANAWVQVGSKDSIETTVDSLVYRTMAEISAALDPEGLAQGDSIVTRAIIYDAAGNFTNGAESTYKFVYDPNKMTVGANQITGGNTLNVDTLLSSDTVRVTWDDFDEPTPATSSGLFRYQVAVSHVGDDSITQFMNWASSQTTASFDTLLPMQHDNQYGIHIRAIDIAGNISDTLASSVFRRYNTKPTLAAMDSAIAYEDVLWKDTLSVSDLDLVTLLSDSMSFYKIQSVGITGAISADSALITPISKDSAIVSWTPLQADTGTYTITAWVKDKWEPTKFIDSTSWHMTVIGVNDTPVVSIITPAREISFEEDYQDTVKYNMTSYATDVDNDSTELSWNAVLAATPDIPGYPRTMPAFVFGPNTTDIAKENIRKKYTPEVSLKYSSLFGDGTVQYPENPTTKMQVTIDTSGGNTYATFDADSNYFITDYQIIFEVSDPKGALASDTTFVTVTPNNDAPELNKGSVILADTTVTENDSLLIDLGSYVTDVDDTLLYFHVSALTNKSYMTISDTSFSLDTTGYIVKFEPQKLWSDSSVIRLIVRDRSSFSESGVKSDTVTFTIDVIRVPRPHLFISVVQNNAFTNFYDLFVTDTAQKVKRCSVAVQGIPIAMDTVGLYTYSGNYNFTSPGVYIFDVMAKGIVGDTSISQGVNLALATSSRTWSGSSIDGSFRVSGYPGSVSNDQLMLISDSTMFGPYFGDQASYLLGNESFAFNGPVEIMLPAHNDNQAIYQRTHGAKWEELPSATEFGVVRAWTENMGYFKLGPKTIFVPELTSIHKNYPNPFNPATTIEYDLGMNEGPRQQVNLSIYNVLGQHVKTLVNEEKRIGRYTVRWFGKDEFGASVSSGIYFARMMTDRGIVKTRKIMLIR